MKPTSSSAVVCGLFLVFNLMICPAYSAAGSDSLLASIPENALFCVRINNYSGSLELLDQYLAGASPMPLSMMLNMGLGGVFGNPMLTGINKYGTFAIAGVLLPGQSEPEMAFLIPVTDFAQFVSASPNSKGPDAQGLYTISTSSGANLTMKPVFNNQYALVVPNKQENTFGSVHAWLTAKGKTMADALAPADLQKAVSSPCWVRVNMQTVYGLVSPLLKQSQSPGAEKTDSPPAEQTADQAADQDAASEPQMDPANMLLSPQSALTGNPFAELWSKSSAPAQQADALLQQLDSVVLSLSVQPDMLSVESALVPKAGSELAGTFTRKTPMTSRFAMGGYLDPQAQINGVMNMNKPMWIRINEIVLNIFAGMNPDGNSAELMTKFKSLMNKSMTAMGSEAAFSFGYNAGTPPFSMREVVEITDEKVFREVIQESTGLVTELYTAMGIPATFHFQQAKENYKGVPIDQASVQFTFPEGTDPQANAAMEALYGKDGLTYPFAVSKNRVLMTMGPAAYAELKKLIDMQSAVPPMPSEMQTAMKLIPQADSADMIASMNIIRLMKGLSEMMAEMAKKTSPEGTPVPPFAQMLEGIPMNTQSTMAIGTRIDQGRIQTHIALPKQHLMEITAVAMQIQQKVMMQQMQQQMQQQQQQPSQPAPSPGMN